MHHSSTRVPMPRVLMPLVLACAVVFLAGTAHGAEMAWKMKAHSLDFSLLKDEVTAIVSDGFVPVGLSVNDEELFMLYVKSPILSMEKWTLARYFSLDELSGAVTDKMKNGYIPMGYGSYGGVHYVLYIKTEHSGTAWRLVPTDLDAEAVKETIQTLAVQGYAPMAINADQGQYQVLLVQLAQGALENWQIGAFDANGAAVRDGINDIAKEGYIPWGVFAGDSRVNILFVQPKGGLAATTILTGGDAGVGLPDTGVGQDLATSGAEASPPEVPETQEPADAPSDTSTATSDALSPVSSEPSNNSDQPVGEDVAPLPDELRSFKADENPLVTWVDVDAPMRGQVLEADFYWRGGLGVVCGPLSSMIDAFPPETEVTISKVSDEGGTLLALSIVPPSGEFAPDDHSGFLLDLGYAPDSAAFIQGLRTNNERNWQDAGPGLHLDLFGGQMTWSHPTGYRAMTETDHRMLMAHVTQDQGWGALVCKE